jgi:hypothetical protein
VNARLSNSTIIDIRAAAHGMARAQKALSLAEELHRLSVERYNAAVAAAGFDPETFRLNPDGTVTDGPAARPR